MRKVIVLLLIGLFQVGLLAGLVGAETLVFSDDFDSFDTDRWSKGAHNLGRSHLDPNNVDVADGNLTITLPANTWDGGEIASNDLYGYGSYSARIKVPHAPSSITGFFLYQPPDYASEIDIEIYNDSPQKTVIYNTYARGFNHTQKMSLPFDPTDGFHEYRFDYAPRFVRFYADGQLMKTWTRKLPRNPMNLYVNTWFPAWLEGQQPNTDEFVLVDQIQYTGR